MAPKRARVASKVDQAMTINSPLGHKINPSQIIATTIAQVCFIVE